MVEHASFVTACSKVELRKRAQKPSSARDIYVKAAYLNSNATACHRDGESDDFE
jgi:hypothetical protein